MKQKSVGPWKYLPLAVLLLAGCAKEQMDPTSSDGKPLTGAPKSLPFFLNNYNTQTNTYSVVQWSSSCVTPWGSLDPGGWGGCTAPNSLIVSGTPSYVRVTNGTCPIDASYLRLARGGTVGAYGPYYVITPANGPAGKLRLKVRVKNVASPALDYYEGKFTYNSVANTWVSASTTDAYDWTTVATVPTAICPPK